MAGNRYMLTAAIDFGTTFSGYAFQLTGEYDAADPTKNILCPQSWNAGKVQLLSMKTPTCVLLDRNKDPDSFGYEAEDKYATLCLDGDHKNWYFFRRFKMKLHDTKGLTKDTTLDDEMGRKLPALTVFAASIERLKKHLTDLLNDKSIHVKDDEIKWVLTVPAIWDDTAKQFMRKAAKQAGIKNEHLTIALEPEAASLYCQYLPVEKFISAGQVRFSDAKPGTTYMIVDLGGGTADITVHEKESNGKLKEIYRASGGPWGGTAVDGAFITMLSDIIGGPVFSEFMREQQYDYLDLMREFESVKRNVSATTKDDINMKLPASLNETCIEKVKKDFKTLVKVAKKDKLISFAGDKMKINPDLIRSLFKKATDKILVHMKKLLDQTPEGKKVSLILMVGGFSESHFVQDVIKQEFHEKSGRKVLIPRDAGISVLNGAVVFGKQPGNITSRILKFTYGVAVAMEYDKNIHDVSKIIKINNKDQCGDNFSKFMEAGTSVKRCQKVTATYHTLAPFQKIAPVNVYTSTVSKPRFTYDQGCTHLGRLELVIPTPSEKLHDIEVEYEFGDTELHITAVDKDSANATCKATLYMLD